jgi:hypothetical protein
MAAKRNRVKSVAKGKCEMSSTRWIYSPNGKTMFYRTGDDIYSQQGIREFWVSGYGGIQAAALSTTKAEI